MSLKFLKFTLYLAGALVFLVGAVTTFGGLSTTVSLLAPLADILLGDTRPIDHLAHPDVDSEMRFYSTIFMGFGALVIHTGATLRQNLHRVPLLAGLFFLGGTARLMTHYFVGKPHGMFDILMVIELAAPVFIYILYRRADRRLF